MKVKSVVLKKKISVYFEDGSKKMNLKPSSVVELLKSSGRQKAIPVSAEDGDERVDEIVEGLGREYKTDDSGAYMVKAGKELSKPKTPGLPYFLLGGGLVFTDAEAAYEAVHGLVKNIDLNPRYGNKLTKTFRKAIVQGQVKSLFKDYKQFGVSVLPKIKAFAEWVAEQSDSENYAKYWEWYKAGVAPDQKETFQRGRVDTSYFKFWSLLKIAEDN
jgi:hypothetical protein